MLLKFFFSIICISDAVLITGGYGYETSVGDGAEISAELYMPSSKVSCSLPRLPNLSTADHSVESTGLLCGGHYRQRKTCLQWSQDTGTWEKFLTLDVERMYHVSWTPEPDIGTYLMGGIEDGSGVWNTTTLIKPDGTQEPGFPLHYDTE